MIRTLCQELAQEVNEAYRTSLTEGEEALHSAILSFKKFCTHGDGSFEAGMRLFYRFFLSEFILYIDKTFEDDTLKILEAYKQER